jgi:hypothetical protein
MTDGRTLGEIEAGSRGAMEIEGLWTYVDNLSAITERKKSSNGRKDDSSRERTDRS